MSPRIILDYKQELAELSFLSLSGLWIGHTFCSFISHDEHIMTGTQITYHYDYITMALTQSTANWNDS